MLIFAYFLVLRPRKYTLFVSQMPCGCISRWQGDSKEKGSLPNQSDLKSFKVLGINRKPGRGDLCPKAGCIHKIAKWNIFGLQGRNLLPLTGKAIPIHKIIIGNCEQNAGDFRRDELIARLAMDLGELNVIYDRLQQPQMFNFELSRNTSVEFASKFRFEEFVRENGKTNKRPSGSSIAAWLKGMSDCKLTNSSK